MLHVYGKRLMRVCINIYQIIVDFSFADAAPGLNTREISTFQPQHHVM